MLDKDNKTAYLERYLDELDRIIDLIDSQIDFAETEVLFKDISGECSSEDGARVPVKLKQH